MIQTTNLRAVLERLDNAFCVPIPGLVAVRAHDDFAPVLNARGESLVPASRADPDHGLGRA
jgi:hypothetical protein